MKRPKQISYLIMILYVADGSATRLNGYHKPNTRNETKEQIKSSDECMPQNNTAFERPKLIDAEYVQNLNGEYRHR